MSTTDRDQANLPTALRERVMAASLLARGAGQTVPAVPTISADEAFERAADAFYRLLGTLSKIGFGIVMLVVSVVAAFPVGGTKAAPAAAVRPAGKTTATSQPAASRPAVSP